MLKREQTYNELRTKLLANHHPGERLPAEREWARQLMCARKTLRFALDRLEKERLILRNTHGTFMFDSRGNRRLNSKPEPVTVLIPCPHFFNLPEKVAQLWHNQVIQGAMRAALEHGTHIVTIPVSPTNCASDIDFGQLDHLNEASRVLCCSSWYDTVFPFLAQRGCRVALCTDRPVPVEFIRNDISFMAYTYTEIGNLLGEIVTQCATPEKSKFFFFGNRHTFNPGWEKSYLGALRAFGLPTEDTFYVYDEKLSLPDRLRLLKELYQKIHFDFLIPELVPTVEPLTMFDIYQAAGLPASVEIMTTTPVLPYLQHFEKNFRICYYPHYEYSYRLAKFLLSETKGQYYYPGVFEYPYYREFINREMIPTQMETKGPQ